MISPTEGDNQNLCIILFTFCICTDLNVLIEVAYAVHLLIMMCLWCTPHWALWGGWFINSIVVIIAIIWWWSLKKPIMIFHMDSTPITRLWCLLAKAILNRGVKLTVHELELACPGFNPAHSEAFLSLPSPAHPHSSELSCHQEWGAESGAASESRKHRVGLSAESRGCTASEYREHKVGLPSRAGSTGWGFQISQPPPLLVYLPLIK